MNNRAIKLKLFELQNNNKQAKKLKVEKLLKDKKDVKNIPYY